MNQTKFKFETQTQFKFKFEHFKSEFEVPCEPNH